MFRLLAVTTQVVVVFLIDQTSSSQIRVKIKVWPRFLGGETRKMMISDMAHTNFPASIAISVIESLVAKRTKSVVRRSECPEMAQTVGDPVTV